jgi:hypothetical protein
MTKKIASNANPDNSEYPAHRIRLPGFITDEEIERYGRHFESRDPIPCEPPGHVPGCPHVDWSDF